MNDLVFEKLMGDVFDTPWTTRTVNGFKNNGIALFLDIYLKQEEKGGYPRKARRGSGLVSFRNFGVKCQLEVEKKLDSLGLPTLQEAPATIKACGIRSESIEYRLQTLLVAFGKKSDSDTIRKILQIV